MLNEVHSDETMSRERVDGCSSSTKGLREDEMTWRMTRGLGVPQVRNEENIQKVKKLERSDRMLAVRMLAGELGMGRGSVRTISVAKFIFSYGVVCKRERGFSVV